MEISDAATGHEPDFVLPHRDAVREDNWAEYEAGGFGVLWESIDPDDSLGLVTFAKHEFGIANVFTGDAYDHEAGRPLRHKPGMGIYVSPEGCGFPRCAAYKQTRRSVVC